MECKIPKNIGLSGRILRFTIAGVLLALAYVKLSWVLLALSLFVFFEAFMSWCVVYYFLGINRCPTKKK
ncbi:MAG: DUF2892 domain-containing protein [Chlamydiae bacterium]|nr:DUF2892 domain-containing protein [Chlamydiota bacterium]